MINKNNQCSEKVLEIYDAIRKTSFDIALQTVFSEKFGDYLKALRLQRHLTQDALAVRAEVDRMEVSRHERNHYVSPLHLKKISKVLCANLTDAYIYFKSWRYENNKTNH